MTEVSGDGLRCMSTRTTLELLFLHALPLDGSMWAGQMEILPGLAHMPTLYGLGDSVGDWARAVLNPLRSDRLVVIGCSVGGSCAIEAAIAAPERIAALVLIGTKARYYPDPELHAGALQTLRDDGLEGAWPRFWAPLFSSAAGGQAREEAKRIALRQSPHDVARGVTAFHSRPSRDQFLSTFPHPVVVVTGADDRAPGETVSAAQAAQAPHGRLHVIPDCGHYVPMERPDVLNSILRELITSMD